MKNIASRRKYHYIYKITRTDGKYYIGMHSTDDLDDEYFGSGQRLWHSINYHGKEAHSKEILEFLPDRESLRKREAEIVNEEVLSDEKCMNLIMGGGAFPLTPEQVPSPKPEMPRHISHEAERPRIPR